jgi:hypothetical protein
VAEEDIAEGDLAEGDIAEGDLAEGDLAEGDLAEGEGGIELAGERDKFTEGEFNVCFCTTIDDGEGIPIPDGEGIPDGDFFDLEPNIKQTYIPAKNTSVKNK